MVRAETQELIAQLKLQDQLSGPLAAAKQNIVQTETALGRVGATARATGAGLGGLTSSLGGIAKAGAAAFVGFQALNVGADFLSGSINAAREDEQSISRLSAALKANVPAWDENKSAIERRIAAATSSAFADDDLRQSLASLVTATDNISRAFDDQSIAIDLARAKNISLGEASQQLVAVEAGRFRGLAQLGISVKDVTTREEALAKIRAAVAGQSQAFLETDAGRAAKLAVSINELQESFGRLVSGPLSEASEKLAQFLDILSGNVAQGIAAQGDEWIAAIKEHFTDATQAELENLRRVLLDELNKAKHEVSILGIDLPIGNFQGEADAIQRALDEVNAELAGTGDAFDTLNGHVDESRTHFAGAADAVQEFSDVIDKSGIGIITVTGTQKDLADKAEITRLKLLGETDAVAELRKQLGLLPKTTNVDVNLNLNINGKRGVGTAADFAADQLGSTAGFAQPNAAGGSALASSIEAARNAREQAAAEALRKAQQAADEAARRAKQRAEELARAYHDKVSVEFDHAKKTADTLFDALHARIDKAIDDAEKLAQKQHDAALQSIKDNLAAEEAAHAAPVNAAEQALAETQAREQRRNLLEAKQAAQQALATNIDPTQTASLARQLRDATEALANFDAAAAIDRLKAAQAAQDAASQATANAATAAADAKLQAAKDEAQKERDAETLAAKKRKDDFETQLAALEKRDTALGKTPKQIQADIDALEKRFGITTDALGFHHIQDPLVSAIKDIKIEPPQVVINNNQKYVLQIGPHELRLIASAAQQANQPQASASVRTGANGRG